MKTISLVRPSTKVEVITDFERNLLKEKLEGPWEEMASLTSNNSLVSLDQITAVRKRFSEIYNQQFLNNSKLNAWCAQRRKLISDYLIAKTGKKNIRLTPAIRDEIITYIGEEVSKSRSMRGDSSAELLLDHLSIGTLARALECKEKWMEYTRSKYIFLGIPNNIRKSLSEDERVKIIEFWTYLNCQVRTEPFEGKPGEMESPPILPKNSFENLADEDEG